MAYVIGDDCIACGTCQGECPVEAISEGEKYSINPDLCTECGTCASVCPSEAISLPNKIGHIESIAGVSNKETPVFFIGNRCFLT